MSQNSDSPDSAPKPEAPRRRSALPERLRYKPMGAAYQGALESVFAIGLATAAGWWADRHWDTSPVWLLTGATIGFAAFVVRLYRLGAAVGESAASDSSRGETSPERPARPESERSEDSSGDRS